MKIKFLILLALFGFSSPARAEENVYAFPDWNSLIETMVGYHAIDFTADDALVDEYAMITHCDWYTIAHDDEFKWRKVRLGLVDLIQKNAVNFPTYYRYDSQLQLGQYDFDAHFFRFAEHGGIEAINAFLISNNNSHVCLKNSITRIPHVFRAVLSAPVYVHGISMSAQDGEALVKRMAADKNTDRVIYARFNLHITNVPRLMKSTNFDSGKEVTTYYQGELRSKDAAQLDATLDSIQFFEDRDMQKLLATYTPPPN